MTETIYLSGPMTGKPDFNKAEFARFAEKYRAQGFRVLSPPELDAGDTSQDWTFYIRRDINVLLNEGVTRIYMMPEWEFSRGARLERHIAESLGIAVHDAETGLLLKPVYWTAAPDARFYPQRA